MRNLSWKDISEIIFMVWQGREERQLDISKKSINEIVGLLSQRTNFRSSKIKFHYLTTFYNVKISLVLDLFHPISLKKLVFKCKINIQYLNLLFSLLKINKFFKRSRVKPYQAIIQILLPSAQKTTTNQPIFLVQC